MNLNFEDLTKCHTDIINFLRELIVNFIQKYFKIKNIFKEYNNLSGSIDPESEVYVY